MDARSFVVRFFVAGNGAIVARVTDARSTRQWLIAEPEALHALERALAPQAPAGEERPRLPSGELDRAERSAIGHIPL